MSNIKSIPTIVLCLFSNLLLGQDINFTQFFINPSLLNPSYVGSEGRPAMYFSYRKQWAGIEGSPQIMNFNIQTALVSRLNLGFNVSNQKTGLVSSTGTMITGGYTVPIAENKFLRFGLSFGVSFNSVDAGALNFGSAPGAANDPLLSGLMSNTTQLLGNLGASYHSKTFHIGIAVPRLFQPTYLTSSSLSTNFKPFDNLVFHASNRFYVDKGKSAVEPYVIYRMANGLPGQIEAALLYHYEHLGWIGASYKQDYGISGLIGFKANKIFALGYSYSVQNSGDNELGKASHEVHITYLFGEKKKKIPQTYSFVDAEKEKQVKKTAAQVAAEKKRQEVIAHHTEKTLPKTTPTKPPDVKVIAPVVVTAPVVLTPEAQHLEEQEKIQRLEVHKEDPLETHNETNHPHAERHEFVKRGEHKSELDFGNYVIVGVFRYEANAKQFNQGVIKMGFVDSDYGYSTVKGLWYVHITETSDIEAARSERDKYRKLKIFRDAWLLTVHE